MTNIINSIVNENTEDWISIDITTYVDGERKTYHLTCDVTTFRSIQNMDYFGMFGHAMDGMLER